MGISADPARLDAFFGDANVPDEDKRAVAAQLRAKKTAAPADTGVYPQPGSDVSVTGALREGLGNIGSAVKSVVGPSAHALARLTSGHEAGLGAAVSDVGTVAGTVLAPEVTAAQIGVGAGARALAPESTAKTAETVTGVAGLAPQAISSGVGAVKAAREAVPAAIRSAGTTLREGLPSAAKALSKRVQGQFYEPVAAYAKEKGLGLAPGSTEANTVADAIDAAHAKWGPTQAGDKLLGQLRGGETPVSYEDLDAAKRLLPSRAKEARGAIDNAIDNLFTGEHAAAGAKLRSGKAAWKLEVAPARKLANRVANAEDPETALRLLADAKHPARAQIAEKLLGGTEDDWKNVLDGIDALRPARGAKLGSYLQRHAIHTGVLGVIFGGPAGALGGLAMYGAGTGIKYASQAGAFLKGGLAGRPAAAALADTISAWGEAQEDEKAKASAQSVATALRGTPSSTSRPSSAPSLGTAGTPSAKTGAPSAGVSLPYSREVSRVAQVVGLDPSLLHAVMRQESGGNPSAVSNGGAVGTPAYGLMQITPDTFETVRPEVERLVGRRAQLNNPIDNIAAGALLYKKYLGPEWTSGDVEQAARYYHGGVNTAYHGPKTQSYGRSVAALYNRFKGGPGYGG